MFFSSDESKILLQELICSPNCDQFSQFIISLTGDLISELPEQVGNIGNLLCSGTWSPDDRLFVYGQFIEEGDTFELVLTILDLETYELMTFTNEDFVYTMLWRLLILPTTN